MKKEDRRNREDKATMGDPIHASDADLLEEYRGGSVDALECLVVRYRRPLFGFIVSMVSSGPEADEIFQEVWFRVLRKIALYRDKNFKAWLMRIAHNIVIDRVRGRQGWCSLDAGWDEEEGAALAATVPSRDPAPDTRAMAGDLGRRIAEAVATLPPEQRAVFAMRVEHDLPFREIARIQGVPINTALARMHYAVGKLRAILKDDYAAVTAGEPAVLPVM